MRSAIVHSLVHLLHSAQFSSPAAQGIVRLYCSSGRGVFWWDGTYYKYVVVPSDCKPPYIGIPPYSDRLIEGPLLYLVSTIQSDTLTSD